MKIRLETKTVHWKHRYEIGNKKRRCKHKKQIGNGNMQIRNKNSRLET